MLVIAEDRASHQVGVEIAVVSALHHAPGTEVHLHCPWAGEEFRAWAHRAGVAQVHTTPVEGASGWDVKPTLLLHHLERTDGPVFWLDSDVVVARDWRPLLAGDGPDVLVATEETAWGQQLGGTHRTRSRGLEVGRPLPTTVNTGFLRVSTDHVPLLEAWRSLLADPAYAAAQQGPWQQRPLHLLGDQEVLTALLGSREFAHVPLHLLRQGVDIAQCYGPAGFTPAARLRAALPGGRVPALVHAMGVKPWEQRRHDGSALGRARRTYEQAHSRWSPYTAVAAAHRDEVGADGAWLPRLSPGRGADARALLAELPLALVDHSVRTVRRRMGIARYEVRGG